MTFSKMFAVLSEYKKVSCKTAVHLYTVVLSDRYTDPPKMFGYIITRPEIIPYEDLKDFLESAIPESYDAYANDRYLAKYSMVIKGLEQRTIFRRVNDAPEDIHEKLIRCFAKANNDSGKDNKKQIREYIEALLEKDNISGQYLNDVVENV